MAISNPLHHSHILNIRGESYRLREKKRALIFDPVLLNLLLSHLRLLRRFLELTMQFSLQVETEVLQKRRSLP